MALRELAGYTPVIHQPFETATDGTKTLSELLADLSRYELETVDYSEKARILREKALAHLATTELLQHVTDGVTFDISGNILPYGYPGTKSEPTYTIDSTFLPRLRHTFALGHLEFYLQPTGGNYTRHIWGEISAASRFIENMYAKDGIGPERRVTSRQLVDGMLLENTKPTRRPKMLYIPNGK